jgi:glyoxylase-like metal-dependent hydrolase (beta-lactamase superfamily II)
MAEIYSTTVSDFMTNSYLVVADGEAALVDPGDDADKLSAMIARSGAEVKYLLATHCHIDHIGGAAEMARRLGLELMAGEKDEFLLDKLEETCTLFGLPQKEKPSVGTYLEDGMELALGGSTLRFMSAPGHSPGSHVIVVDTNDIIVGDVLFQGSVGRTDLPGGDTRTLMESIRDVILPMDDAVTVHTGHGPPTTVGRERRENFFIIEWGLAS